MGPHVKNEELCLRGFSKSLTNHAYTWYATLKPSSIATWDNTIESFCSNFFFLMKEKNINIITLHNGLFYYIVKFLIFSVWTSLFFFFFFCTSPYSHFFFQLTSTNDVWCFFLYLLFITLYCFFFYHLSLSLSLSLSDLLFFKIWWWFYDIKYALLVSLCKFGLISSLIFFLIKCF